jgi:hypothetical protein
MLDDNQLKNAMQNCPAKKVEKDYIDSRIVKSATVWTKFGETVTICQITLDNGYSVRGESACVNAANYRQEIGEKIAYDNAFNKLWPLFGFDLAETQHKKAA